MLVWREGGSMFGRWDTAQNNSVINYSPLNGQSRLGQRWSPKINLHENKIDKINY